MDCPEGRLAWLETSRFGSFAFGCVDRKLRSKYHALWTVREPGRGDAWNVLAELRETLVDAHGRTLLVDPLRAASSDVELVSFRSAPHVRHRYRIGELELERTLDLSVGDQLAIHYRVRGVRAPLTLELEPLLRCRDLHALTFENPFLDGSFTRVRDELHMTPYAGMPSVAFRVDGADMRFVRDGTWQTDVSYADDAARGDEAREDLFSPGRFVLTLEQDGAFTLWVGLETLTRGGAPDFLPEKPASLAHALARATRQFAMHTRAGATTVVAGFPSLGPRSRDTLIALPGLYLADRDFERAAAVLESLADARVNGLIPRVPAFAGRPADTSAADPSLLFARAVQWLGHEAGASRVARFMPVVCELLEALADARDSRMRLDRGVGVWLERAAQPLTWMDAQREGEALTPRAGYAIEIDALAYNAAVFACRWADAERPLFARAFRARLRGAEADFVRRYWDDTRGYLADGHDGTRPDTSLRPNQLFALGLPHRALPDALARAALAAVTRELVVPAGVRTLSPHDPRYQGTAGGCAHAPHQGAAWPWLLGLYADAVQALHGRSELEARFVPVRAFFANHLEAEGCLGHMAELFAGDSPHSSAGAPAQAWSVAELSRALHTLRPSAARETSTDVPHSKVQLGILDETGVQQ